MPTTESAHLDLDDAFDSAGRIAALTLELGMLKARLEESEDTLRALHHGEVDAIVVGGDVFTLAGADAASNRLRGDALAQMEDAVIATDMEGRVIYVNPAAERQYERSASAILGCGIQDLYVQHWLSEADRLECELALNGGGFWRGQTRQTSRSRSFLLECTFSCMHETSGRKTGYLAVMRDISARANAEAALAESQARLDFALQSALIGDWEFDLASGSGTASARYAQCFGYDELPFGWSIARMLAHVHPEDYGIADEALRIARERKGDCHFECRVVWPDRSVHWIHLHGNVFVQQHQPDRLVGIVVDVTERRQAEETLRDADRKKDEFLATLAHELRNPLAPIRNAAHVLASGAVSPEVFHRSTAIIKRQVAQMARLLDDLLDVARITRGQLVLKKSLVDLQTIVSTAVETARPLIDAKHHQLTIHIPNAPICLEADPVRLSQVVANLLNNAAKYSDPGATITITAGQDDAHHCFLSVRDTGIGLSESALRSVFNMFAQEDTALERSEGGLGIGLALVKGLVSLHEGTVEAKSAGIGFGSEFTLRLSVRAAASKDILESVAPAQGIKAHQVIMIADDNIDAAESLATLLRLKGHEVFLAKDGLSAIARATETRPSIAVVDIGMPGLNGYEVAKHIRSETWGQDTLLIAATGWGQDDDRHQAHAAGFDAHLTKPFDPDDLLVLIDRNR